MQAATVLQSLAPLGPCSAIGPASRGWPFVTEPAELRLVPVKPLPRRARILIGRAQLQTDRDFGHMVAEQVRLISPAHCYGFTQISRETAAWCADHNVPFVLDNPNGHIENVRSVYQRESWRWCHVPFLGHPTKAAVVRVEAEYALATRIRVSSDFSKQTMVRAGVPAEKIEVIPQFLNLDRFRRPPDCAFPRPDGPLRVCFVGSLDLRKGFVYLLRAIRKVGPQRITLRIVGNTGDPWCNRLFQRESRGLDIQLLPGDPVPTYHWAELSVTPSLEDGFGFVVAEAMAAGVPVIVSDQSGAAEWAENGASGWIAAFEPSARIDPEQVLAQLLQTALDNRGRLREMGQAGLQSVSRRGHESNASLLARWYSSAAHV